MQHAFWILTIGSARQSKEIYEHTKHLNISVHHVIEEKNDWVVKPYNEILQEVESIICNSISPPLAIVNLGRSTVPKGIELIAKCSEEIKLKYKESLVATKIIGPGYSTAKIFNDKWRTYKILKDNDFPLPYTEKLSITDNPLNDSLTNFPFPAVFKLTNLTGGAGMEYINQESELLRKIKKFTTKKHDMLLSEFVKGYEFSVVVLSLGHDVLVHPIGLKAPTDKNLIHVDNKIKVNGYLKPIDALEKSIIQLVKNFGIQGHFTLEGIITCKKPFQYVVLETATRITGSFHISNASLGFNPFKAIGRYALGMDWLPKERKQQTSISIPIYRHKSQNTMKALEKYSWIISARLDQLEKMPFSKDNRIRLTVGLIVDNLLIEKLKILERESGDYTIIDRVKKEFSELNHEFSGMINERLLI
ncbi:ATP-grasp domain-containing protein [Bacillus thuringiensis]|uniref:ATP-grasp domain-containing protein n=1 Tax=Bacillus thuringiensis TaxID=1428 RepID=UPI00398752BB